MTIRQFGPKTQHDYVRVVADIARFLGPSPDPAEPKEFRRYRLHLADEGTSPAKMTDSARRWHGSSDCRPRRRKGAAATRREAPTHD